MNHKELDAWKKSIELVVDVYRIVSNFPIDEKYGLMSQIKRCVVFIPSNIAEGCARKSDKELLNFLYISLGSLSELETQVVISEKLTFVNSDTKDQLNNQMDEVGRLIMGLVRYVKNKK